MRILIATDAWRPQVNGVVQTLTQLINRLEEMGHQVRVVHPGLFKTVPCPTYPEIRLALWPFSKVNKALAEFEPDAVHIVTEGPIGLATRLWVARNRVPFTSAYHTRFPEYVNARTGIPVKWVARLLRWFHSPAQRVMVPTQTMINTLEEHGITNSILWQRGVDLKCFNPEQSQVDRDLHFRPVAVGQTDPEQLRILDFLEKRIDHCPVYLYAGRVAVEKNLEAFLKLDLPGEKWVAGDGPARKKLQEKYPNAHWFGMLNHAALSELYKRADVFVFPSLTDTFGLVMLEAMASGCPVAAFPVTGPLDVIGDTGAGVLDDDLKTAIEGALRIPREVPRKVAARYSWKHCAEVFVRNLAPIDRSKLKSGVPSKQPAALNSPRA